uniref:SWIM-type domain-containing protein n=1 Tax=Lactuca sativa TaxID=4236 RepID=A0A9R1XF57_LACSA|nr:hypothetical protein LSAT_V11C400182410 [Lactuca sativa]
MSTFYVHDIDDMMLKLGYIDEDLHVEMPLCDMDFGLFALSPIDDVRHLAKYVGQHKLIEDYTEHGQTKLHTYSMSPNPSKVRIVEIDCTLKRLFLEWYDTQVEPNDVLPFEPNRNNPPASLTRNEPSIDNVDMVIYNAFDMETEIEHDSDDSSSDDYSSSGDDSDSQDGDFLVDENNIINDVDVDIREFHLNVDLDVEWIGGASKRKHHVVTNDGNEPNIEVIDNELFFSESSSCDGIEAIRRSHENENAQVSEPFYLYPKFKSSKEFKDRVNQHVIDTRSELDFDKNDKNKVSVVCKGTITSLSGKIGQEVVNEKGKRPWVLLASKWKCDKYWTVKTYVISFKENSTTGGSKPKNSSQGFKGTTSRIYKVDISKMKAFRARETALKIIRGDYATQYKILQDYLLEVHTQNLYTIIKLDVESEPNPDVEKRTFGHALDGNNGIYPFAYVVVEAETLNSWTWFLTHLGDDLGFAIVDLFPCTEHRYCLRHIHENMRSCWRGDEFKELLWNCSTSCTEQEFEKGIEEIRKLNQDCKLLRGRDAPIINCLEFIMKRIVNVDKEIDKATIKDEAEKYITSFCGNGKYQVNGPWQDHCSRKKWEITGIPCKHVVSSIRDMMRNDVAIGISETFVHECYWLSTWRNMYSFKVDPINGRRIWMKSPCPTTLLLDLSMGWVWSESPLIQTR